jgi:Tol biopolymer transport system component
LLTLQQSSNSSIEVLPGGDWHRARKITTRNTYQEGIGGIDWTPDGIIVYSSLISGYSNLWTIDPESKSRRQLTSNHFEEYTPSVSYDGRFIAYASEHDTTPHIWVMDIDGNNQRSLTTGGLDDYLPRFAPNNHSVYFDSYRDKGRRNLWKISVNGGDPIKVTDKYIDNQGISPDGQFILAHVQENNTLSDVVVSLETGKVFGILELPVTAGHNSLRWMPDGKGVAYIDTRNGVSTIWVMPLATKKPYQLTKFDSELIGNFVWSKDGKNLAIVRGEDTGDIVLLNDKK